MKRWKFKGLLTESGWKFPGYLSAEEGIIQSFEPFEEHEIHVKIDGYALPGFQNAHSHAFQYAMAGKAEHPDPENPEDDFWTWRESMYRLALNMTPDQVEAVATHLYKDMRSFGYTAVAEFHYLHHQSDGTPYDNLTEMGERLVLAAERAGIRITLIPVFYQTGGFHQPPSARQARFISKNGEDYLELYAQTEKMVQKYPLASAAVGLHSLRAVSAESVLEVLASVSDVPVHIHVAEQLAEVEECLKHTGMRPVEWLLERMQPDQNFHLVHATHVTEEEIRGIAERRANVVLCPTTEGNLGDGIFPLRKFQELEGSWSIGTDSHIGINPLEELRFLDYGQRLISHRRDTFYREPDPGLYAIRKAWMAGRLAMGESNTRFFSVGSPFDACILDAAHPYLREIEPENILTTAIYRGERSIISGTYVKGDWASAHPFGHQEPQVGS